MQAPETVANQAIQPKSRVSAYLRLMRPKQWAKNLIAFAPLVFAGKIHEPQLLQNATLCVIAFCLLSSCMYIVNDILDRDADKLHPIKCKRPIASGEVSVASAWILALMLAPPALLIGFMLRPALILVLLAYLGLTVTYSLVLKHIAIVDVLSIAAGFLLRAEAGAVAVHVPLSSWFLLCTGLGAIFLALEKRRSELSTLQHSADTHRPALQAYSTKLLDRLEALILPSLLTSYIFYSFLSVHGQWMMLTVPFVVFGLMRYQQLSTENEALTGAPEDALFKDRPIQIAVILWLASTAGVIYGGIPNFLSSLVNALDSIVH